LVVVHFTGVAGGWRGKAGGKGVGGEWAGGKADEHEAGGRRTGRRAEHSKPDPAPGGPPTSRDVACCTFWAGSSA